MMRLALAATLAVAAAAALPGCTARQARSVHRAGEVMTAGGLIGLMGAIALAEVDHDDHTVILHGGFAFVPISIVGALMYAATDSTVNRPETPSVSADRTRDTAMSLAKEAKHAARRGDCAEVLALEPRVRDLDAGIYRRFRHDEVIKTCLPPDEPAPVELTNPPALPGSDQR